MSRCIENFIRIPKRCDNPLCRILLPLDKNFYYKSKRAGKEKFYCDKWCMEQGEEKELFKYQHLCACGLAVIPYIYSRGNNKPSTTYSKYCENCTKKRKEEREERTRIRREKENRLKQEQRDERARIKLIGHTCSECKIFKTWDNFHNKNGKKNTICKPCANEYSRKYHQKNKEKQNLYQKIYYRKYREIKGLKNKKKKNLTFNL